MSDFGEARTSKIVLPCGRRAYYAKTGRRGNYHEKGLKWEPTCCQNGAKMDPWGVIGRFFVILGCLFWDAVFA